VIGRCPWQWRDRLGGRGGASWDAIGFDGTTFSEAGREPSIATIGGGAVDSVAASICGSAIDSVAVVRQTRWRNLLTAAAARHYNLIGRSKAHPP
jgi:hypothetical protein